MKLSLSTAVAIGVGLVVLVAWFVPLPLLVSLRVLFLDWAVLLAAAALLLVFLYLVLDQFRATLRRRPGWPYRLLAAMTAVVTFVVLSLPQGEAAAPWLLRFFIVPASATLLGLVAVVLTYRMLWFPWRRGGRGTLFFLTLMGVTVLYLLYAWNPRLPGVALLWTWIEQVVTRAGVRGLLLSMSLGILALGLRLLGGAERPYEGS